MLFTPSKNWTQVLFHLPKSDTFRRLLPALLLIGGYSALVVWAILFHLPQTHQLFLKNATVLHSLLGFAISLLLVFRTNTAYDRWWEGRKHWGALVNNSRNLAVKINCLLAKEDSKNRIFFQKLIPLFADELRLHLQNERTRLALDDSPHPEIPRFDTAKHIPNQLAQLMQQKVQLLYRDRHFDGYQLLQLNNDITAFLDICGACERIKNTPIPYSYRSFIQKFLLLYILTIPPVFALTLGWYAVPVTLFIAYVLGSLELIAEEIEDPFGKDENDLPMHRIADTIRKNIQEILS